MIVHDPSGTKSDRYTAASSDFTLAASGVYWLQAAVVDDAGDQFYRLRIIACYRQSVTAICNFRTALHQTRGEDGVEGLHHSRPR